MEDFPPMLYGKSVIYKSATNYNDVNASEKLIITCKELNKILNSIVKNTKKNLRIK